MPSVMFVDLLADIYDLHGIYALSGFMKHHGIEVHFARGRNYKKVLAAIAKVKPDLLLYSALSTQISRYIEFDRVMKEALGIRSLIGGPGPTFFPSCIKDSTIDAACIGEGEQSLVDFVRSGFRGARNIFRRGEGFPSVFDPLVDPDRMPLPDRSLVYDVDPLVRDMPSKQFISGRGCPYHCTYCFNHEFNRVFEGCGPVVRKKSVGYLLQEIEEVRRRYPLSNVAFNDDTFIVNKKWFFEFAVRFARETRLSYTCNVRANLVDDDIAQALKESRCAAVNWSIESGNDVLRNEVLKRGMSRDDILRAATALRKHGIPFRIGNVIGLPGETIGQMLETVELNIEAAPALATAAIFTPFPGLAITRYAVDHGYYDPAAGLPRDMFTRSVMKVGPDEDRMIQRISFLFPFFVIFPGLYRDVGLRGMLLKFPVALLKWGYHLFMPLVMIGLYRVRSSFLHRCRMALRYLSLLFS